MSEKYAEFNKVDGRGLGVTVSRSFGLVKLEDTDRGEMIVTYGEWQRIVEFVNEAYKRG